MRLRFLLTALIFPLLAAAQNDPLQAKKDSVQRLIDKAEHDTLKARYLIDLSSLWRNDPDKCMEIARQALELSGKNSYKRGAASASHIIGRCYHEKGDFNSSLDFYQKALLLNGEAGLPLKQANNLNNIGNIYLDKGDYKQALRYHLEAFKKREQGKDTAAMAISLMNLGLVHDCLQDLDKALDNYNLALQYSLAAGSPIDVASCYANIGAIHQRNREFNKAIDFMQKGLAICEQDGNTRDVAMALNNLGYAYLDQGSDYGKALEYLQRSLRLKEQIGDQRGIANCLLNIGIVYSKTGNHAKAEENLFRSLPIARAIGYREGPQQCYLALADNYFAKKDFEKAYLWYQRYSTLKDSLLSEASGRTIGQMQVLYDTERKNREIAELNRDNEKQDAALRQQQIVSISIGIGLLLVILLAFFIYRGYRQKKRSEKLLEEKNRLIEEQSRLVQDKNKNITDSINYAQRIQSSILPPDRLVQQLLPDSFVLYKPKDIVSGDFYWVEKSGDKVLFAAVDCTGHGVPGAMMSVMGFNLLSQAVSERKLSKPSDILRHLDAGVNTMLRQSTETNTVKDGMDLALCAIDFPKKELQYAGAYNGLWVVKGNGETETGGRGDRELLEIKADKSPIGVNIDGKVDDYTNHTLQLKTGDCIYIFSDGYADQFGGPRGKKFKYKAMKELLLSIRHHTMPEQEKILGETFNSWKGSLEQVDDVLVIGVRV